MTNQNSDNKKSFLQEYGQTILLWLGILAGIVILLQFHVDKKLIAIVTITLGLFTKAFAGLGIIISLIPIVGPLIVHIFTLPFFWLINGLASIVSVVAIRKGYNREVLRSRVMTVALLVGILIGYILGHLLPIR